MNGATELNLESIILPTARNGACDVILKQGHYVEFSSMLFIGIKLKNAIKQQESSRKCSYSHLIMRFGIESNVDELVKYITDKNYKTLQSDGTLIDKELFLHTYSLTEDQKTDQSLVVLY